MQTGTRDKEVKRIDNWLFGLGQVVGVFRGEPFTQIEQNIRNYPKGCENGVRRMESSNEEVHQNPA